MCEEKEKPGDILGSQFLTSIILLKTEISSTDLTENRRRFLMHETNQFIYACKSIEREVCVVSLVREHVCVS